jgi:hypothetical protein
MPTAVGFSRLWLPNDVGAQRRSQTYVSLPITSELRPLDRHSDPTTASEIAPDRARCQVPNALTLGYRDQWFATHGPERGPDQASHADGVRLPDQPADARKERLEHASEAQAYRPGPETPGSPSCSTSESS